jgi:hypothetical protein
MEFTNTNCGPFLLFDDYDWQEEFSSYSKIEYRHHSHFNVLYHADNFNREGVLKVLKKHGFEPVSVAANSLTIGKWLRRNCKDIFETCLEEGECDPDCGHYKYT